LPSPPDPRPSLVYQGLEILSDGECRDLLASRRVGRVVLSTGAVPQVFPVNFVMVGGDVVFFTGEGAKLTAALTGATVTFQVDHVDLDRREGWSVLAVGTASLASDELADRAHALGCWPWAAGDRHRAVRVRPEFLSGRRILA
jgi:uncharacterized protein